MKTIQKRRKDSRSMGREIHSENLSYSPGLQAGAYKQNASAPGRGFNPFHIWNMTTDERGWKQMAADESRPEAMQEFQRKTE